jgi:hypothetical protein
VTETVSGEPGWLAGFDRHLAAIVAGHGTAISIALAVVCDLIAVSIFVPRLARAGIVAAAITGASVWVTQAFGGILTGRGTDPNSGLVIVLLAAAFWPLARRAGQMVTAGQDATSEPDRPTKGSDHRIGLLVALALLVTSCAAGHQTARATPSGAPMPADMSMDTHSAASSQRLAAGPSESARMVCSSEIHRDIAMALALPAQPPSTTTWTDHLYTCTYLLQGGPLVVAVKELKDVPAARAYFGQMNRNLGSTRQILGLANLGLPGYQTSSGAVTFLKEDKTLEVDASALPAQVGPNHISRTDFAYQIATDILGCWTDK